MGGTPQLPRNMGDASGFIRWMNWVQSMISFILEKLNNPFANTGMSVPGPGVVECDGQFNVVGNETVSGTLNVTGNTVIGGTLSLPNGIINNAALNAPVIPGVVNLYTSNFGLGTGSYVELAGQDLTVPAGCTQLLFDGSAAVECFNPKTTGGNNGVGGDYLYARVEIGANSSPGSWATGVSGSNGNATATAGFAWLVTGLTPGSTIRASVYGVSDYGIATNASNQARLNATLVWLR